MLGSANLACTSATCNTLTRTLQCMRCMYWRSPFQRIAPMDRTLRPLAILSLAVAVVYTFVLTTGPNHADSPLDPAALRFFALWAPLLGATCLLLAFAVGVVALVA